MELPGDDAERDRIALDRLAYEALGMFELSAEADNRDYQMQAVRLLEELYDIKPDSIDLVHEELCVSDDFRHRAIGAATLGAALPHGTTRVIERWGELLGDEKWRVAALAADQLTAAMKRGALDRVNLRRIVNTGMEAVRNREPYDNFREIWVQQHLIGYEED